MNNMYFTIFKFALVTVLVALPQECLGSRAYVVTKYGQHPIKTEQQFWFARLFDYPLGLLDEQGCQNVTVTSNTPHSESWKVPCMEPVEGKPGMIQIGRHDCKSTVSCEVTNPKLYLEPPSRHWSSLALSFIGDSYKEEPVSCDTYWDPVHSLIGLAITLTYTISLSPYTDSAPVLHSCKVTPITQDHPIEAGTRFIQTWTLVNQAEEVSSGGTWLLEAVLVFLLIGVVIAIGYVVLGYVYEKRRAQSGDTYDLEGEKAISLQLRDPDNL